MNAAQCYHAKLAYSIITILLLVNPVVVEAENNNTSLTDESISVCGVIASHLPPFCKCINYISKPTMGQINCTVKLPYSIDTLLVVSTIAPCADPAYIKIRVFDGRHIDHTFGPLTASGIKELPIPYLSIGIPGVGDAGVTAAVGFGGNLENLHVDLGIDACLKSK